MIQAQVYQRVVRVVGERQRPGAGVLIDQDDRHFLITSKHLCTEEAEEYVTIQHILTNDGKPFSEVLARVGDRTAEADVAVFEVGRALVPADLALEVRSDGMVYSDDAYILGYPYGLTLATTGEEPQHLPVVKKGILSASNTLGGVRVHYLDTFANPGFSGGPAVVRPPGGRLQVVGIVKAQLSGPATEPQHGKPPPPSVPAGITVVVDAQHVQALLRS